MVRLEKHGDSAVRFIFTDSDHYLYKDGVVDVPVNSLSLVIDESEMVTFKKASTADPFISFRLDKSNFSSRDELLTFYKENMVGAGGISEEEVQEMIDAATSGIPSSEVVEQLRRDVNAVSGEVDTKQDILTAGENITISGNVISADAGNNIIELTQAEYDVLETKDPEALYIITDAQEINMNDYYTKSEVDAEIASIDLSSKADASALTAHTANTEVHVTSAEKDVWNAKADASALTAVQDSLSGYVTTTTYESGQYATAQALNALQENKLDASAYTPTDLSEYWTSGQTQNAINAHTADTNVHFTGTQKNKYDYLEGQYYVDDNWDIMPTSVFNEFSNEFTVAMGQFDQRITANASGITELESTKLDASAYTPTDLSEYWTSGQTQNAINAATSGIPSSQVIEQLQTDVNNLQGETNDIWDTIDEKEEVIASALTQLNQDVSAIDAKEEVIASALTQLNQDVSAIDAKEEVIASALTEVRQDVNKKANVCYVDFITLYYDDADITIDLWYEWVEALKNNAIFYTSKTHADDGLRSEPLLVLTNPFDPANPDGMEFIKFYMQNESGWQKAEIWRTGENEFSVLTDELTYEVDDQLNSASTNPVQNAVITQTLENKLDASAYTPTDLSQYWTSAQTQNAINAATSGIPSSQVIEQFRTDLNTLSGAVIDNEYTVSQAINSLNDRVTAVEEDTLTAGSGITISNNVISTTGVVMSQQVTQIVKLTQAQYSALSTKDNQTLYIVVD